MKHLSDLLPDSMRSALFVDDAPPAKTPPRPVPTPKSSTPFRADSILPDLPHATEAQSSELPLGDYASSLTARTDFYSTEVGAQVRDHLQPLDGLPLSEEQKLAVVLKAGAKQGLTGERILNALHGTFQALEQEQASFNTSLGRTVQAEVDTRKAEIHRQAERIADLEKQIATARAAQSSAAEELSRAQSSVDEKRMSFQAAFDARSAQIKADIAHYESLLKGQQ